MGGVCTRFLRHRQGPHVRPEDVQCGHEEGIELEQIGVALRLFAESESPPPFLQVVLIPPRWEGLPMGKLVHLGKGFVKQPDVIGVNDGALQHTGIHQEGIALDDAGLTQLLKHDVCKDRHALWTQSLSESAQGTGIQERGESFIGNVAEILPRAILSHRLDDPLITEVTQA